MALTLAIANQKGGVGKTTIATQYRLRPGVAPKQRRFSTLTWTPKAMGRRFLKRERILRAVKAHDLFDTSLDIVEPQPSNYPGIDIIPTKSNSVISYSLEGLSDECIRDPRMQLDKIRCRYDIIVIDCPPNLGIKLKASSSWPTPCSVPSVFAAFQ